MRLYIRATIILGGLAETTPEDGSVGPLFACIIKKQVFFCIIKKAGTWSIIKKYHQSIIKKQVLFCVSLKKQVLIISSIDLFNFIGCFLYHHTKHDLIKPSKIKLQTIYFNMLFLFIDLSFAMNHFTSDLKKHSLRVCEMAIGSFSLIGPTRQILSGNKSRFLLPWKHFDQRRYWLESSFIISDLWNSWQEPWTSSERWRA